MRESINMEIYVSADDSQTLQRKRITHNGHYNAFLYCPEYVSLIKSVCGVGRANCYYELMRFPARLKVSQAYIEDVNTFFGDFDYSLNPNTGESFMRFEYSSHSSNLLPKVYDDTIPPDVEDSMLLAEFEISESLLAKVLSGLDMYMQEGREQRSIMTYQFGPVNSSELHISSHFNNYRREVFVPITARAENIRNSNEYTSITDNMAGFIGSEICEILKLSGGTARIQLYRYAIKIHLDPGFGGVVYMLSTPAFIMPIGIPIFSNFDLNSSPVDPFFIKMVSTFGKGVMQVNDDSLQMLMEYNSVNNSRESKSLYITIDGDAGYPHGTYVWDGNIPPGTSTPKRCEATVSSKHPWMFITVKRRSSGIVYKDVYPFMSIESIQHQSMLPYTLRDINIDPAISIDIGSYLKTVASGNTKYAMSMPKTALNTLFQNTSGEVKFWGARPSTNRGDPPSMPQITSDARYASSFVISAPVTMGSNVGQLIIWSSSP